MSDATPHADASAGGDIAFVESPLPAKLPLNDEERERILDNYRWFSRFPPGRKLLIAWRQSQMALYLRGLARGTRT